MLPRGGNRLNAIFDLAKRCGQGLKLHGGFWGPGGTCFAQVLKPSKCSISTWQRAMAKRCGRVWGPGGTCFAQVLKSSKCTISTWQGRGKGRKVHRRVSRPSETCLAQVWKRVYTQYSTWQSAGKGLKLHGGFWGPGGTCFAQVLKPSEFRALVERASRRFWNPLNAEFRPGKAGAKGERCTGGFRVLVKRAWRRCGNRLHAIFDLAKRWQRAKAARRVLGPWWNVLRAGFETL